MAKKWHQLEKLDHKALKKLQADRERAVKQAQEAQDKKRRMIIGGAVLFFFCFLAIFFYMMKSRSAEIARQEERDKMLFSKVVDFTGKIDHRNLGLWEKLKDKFEFDKEYTFRTEKESSVTVKLQLDNQVKLSGESEMTVYPPVLHKKENKIEKEPVKLKRGEITAAVSLDGRGLLEIESAGIVVNGSSGLFKVIYDDRKDKGEVVVKNGLVEVSKKRGGGKPVKVSGFYKVTFSEGNVSTPTQASVIQYDWR
jgi:ferric-dicitrate binding protein FerR (iron transport regulator)